MLKVSSVLAKGIRCSCSVGPAFPCSCSWFLSEDLPLTVNSDTEEPLFYEAMGTLRLRLISGRGGFSPGFHVRLGERKGVY